MDRVRERVLVLCTGNSCRSQIAEAWINHLFADRVEAHSAGHMPSGYVHPLAIKVMGEVGIDIHDARSKHMDEYLGQAFDKVITVCDPARDACPVYPGKMERIHQPFEDPSFVVGSEEAKLAAFRKTRDEIRNWVDALFRYGN